MQLRRDEDNAMIFGVCAGLSKALDVDVAIIRAITLAGALLTGGVVIIAYIVLAVAMPAD